MATERNPAKFHPYNVVDACSIWNILSSKKLYNASVSVLAKCNYCCTKFVYYECVVRPRKVKTKEDSDIQNYMIKEREQRKQFKDYPLEIEDLYDAKIMDRRKNLGKGELTSILFAKKTQQAFITDDKQAREFAEEILSEGKVQTTPHLFGWLIYKNILVDTDKDIVIEEHSKIRRELRGNLSKFFNIMYMRACESKLKDRSN